MLDTYRRINLEGGGGGAGTSKKYVGSLLLEVCWRSKCKRTKAGSVYQEEASMLP